MGMGDGDGDGDDGEVHTGSLPGCGVPRGTGKLGRTPHPPCVGQRGLCCVTVPVLEGVGASQRQVTAVIRQIYA